MTKLTPSDTILGIDIGGTKVAFALGGANGELRARRRHPMETSGDSQADVARLVADALRMVREEDAPRIAAVGISVPGPFDFEAGTVDRPPNLPGWERVPLRDPFARAFGCPVALENDANAAALAEWRFGAGRGAQNLVYLTMSTGVGGGLVLDGRVHHGVHAAAGEVGHIPIEWEGEPCACGMRGCLEAYVGGAAWTKRLRRLTPPESRVRALAGSLEAITPEHLVAGAREGDAFALSEMARFNDYLARGICQLAFVLAPEVVVLGTIATAAGEALCFEPVRRQVRSHTWDVVGRTLEIRAAELGEDLPYQAGICAALAGTLAAGSGEGR